MIKGVIFDMDGVLVDSEPFICQAAIRMFAELGHTVQPEDFLPFVGAGEDRYIGGVAEKYGIEFDLSSTKDRTYAIYGEIVKGRLKPLDGVHRFIDKARAKGLKLAIASSADSVKVNINLREIGLNPSTFDAVVCGADVEKKKPNPDIFLLAAERIHLSPGECLVVEDAVNGVKAAKAAGARCLALTTSFSREELAGADWFAPNLAEAPEECLNW
jgi:HAD superfamily hydrolase (TIGR01509 family)